MAKRRATPIRAHLLDGSPIQPLVADGIQALETGHRKYLHDSIRSSFADSLDLDGALRGAHPQDNRWDYLLGLNAQVVGLEPHSAVDDEVATVIAKRKSALQHLSPHLKPGKQVAGWFWVASGRVKFASTGRERLRLAQNGVTFVGKVLGRQHLSGLSSQSG